MTEEERKLINIKTKAYYRWLNMPYKDPAYNDAKAKYYRAWANLELFRAKQRSKHGLRLDNNR